MADPITLAIGLSKVVPGIVRWLGGDKAGDVADTAIDVAKTIAGVDDGESALTQIQNDPALQIAYQQAMQPVLVARYEAETKQLESINATMRAEYASKQWFIAGWRPFFGYIVAVSWLLLMVALGYVIFAAPDKAPAVISAMASLSFMWSIALAVLGISVRERSKDKQVAAGHDPGMGLMGAIASRIMK